MARSVEGPWFRASKNTWYATRFGKGVSLRVRGEDGKAEAFRAWHRLMADMPLEAGEPAGAKAPEGPKPKAATVAVTVERYLAEAAGWMKPASLAVVSGRLKPLAWAFGWMGVADFTEDHFREYLRPKGLSPSSLNGYIGSAKAYFAWMERKGILSPNPIRHMKRPACASRGSKAAITDAVHLRLMAGAGSDLRALLILLKETGARPSELTGLEAKDVDFANAVAIIHRHKTDASGKPRLIFLSPQALAILKPLAAAHPEGKVLRTGKGYAWRKNGIAEAIKALSEAVAAR